MFNRNYQQEMNLLKCLLEEFASAHPELAPLVSGPMADQDVERLTEGVAFMTARLRQKLDDDYPEIIHHLTELFHPWHLRPIPATSIVAFTPGVKMDQPQLIPAGAEVMSLPIEGTRCRFRTCYDVEVHPLTLLDAFFFHPSGQAPSIRLRMELNGPAGRDWRPKSLRFFLGGSFSTACDLYLLLLRYLKRIVITSDENGIATVIPADCLKPAGLNDGETILPKNHELIPGHQILQEFFLFPDKFLFVELTGFVKWRDRGDCSRFDITFVLTKCPFSVPPVGKNSFVLSAAPVINLFHHQSMPLQANDPAARQLIRPANKPLEHYQVYSLDQLTVIERNTARNKSYAPFNPLNHNSGTDSTYYMTLEKSPAREGFDAFLSRSATGSNPASQGVKLVMDLTCTNGALPEHLRIGEICVPTAATPESVEFSNITPITPTIFTSSETNRLWRTLSNLSLNHLSLSSVDNFRSILRLYITSESRNQAAVAANKKRIDGIEGIEAKPADLVMAGRVIRGYEIRLKVHGGHFSGPDDLYVFSSILERFMGGYVTENCFTRLTVEDITGGYVFGWPARMGDRHVV